MTVPVVTIRRSRWGRAAGRLPAPALAAVALCLAVAAPAAPARAAKWPNGVHMKEAVANVMVSAKTLGDLTEYGYAPGTCFLAAFIQRRASVSMNIPMDADTSYIFLGGGSKDADDVDIEVLDSRGRAVARDDDADATPVVKFTPVRSGKYTLRLTLFKADSACFCAVAILQRGGYTVPIQNLADATNDLIGFCNDVWSSGSSG